VKDLTAVLAQLSFLDADARHKARAHLDVLTKPPGSLGRLETLVLDLAGMTATSFPRVDPPAVIVFAADHGVAAEGVSAFPQEVTAQMVANFSAGGAAINVFARSIDAHLEVVDVGVLTACESLPGVVVDRVRAGTGNIAREDAMTLAEAEDCLMVGVRAVERAVNQGCQSLILGEMGIANTSASSALLAVLAELPVNDVVGRGTGLDDRRLAHKREVIKAAVTRCQNDHNGSGADPLETLASVGGLEIGAIAGACLGAAALRRPVLVDGFIATVAALLACRLDLRVREYLVFGHRSEESGHRLALEVLGAHPLLDLGLRLGEGSGAALAYPLVASACAMLSDMATFDSAGVEAGVVEGESDRGRPMGGNGAGGGE